jgi:sugar/nucleoside kinase (ribokinase family)
MNLLVVGTVAFDMIETPHGKTDKILGGAGTYAGLAAGLLTDNIGLVSVVGGDFPRAYLDMFTQKGIDVTGVKYVEDGKSFFWSGRYHENMNHRDTLVTELNVLADFDPVLPATYKNSRYLMLGNLTPAIQKKVIEQMEVRPELICMDTMNFWMDTSMDDLLDVLKMVDVLTINDEEARQLSGEYSLSRAAKKVLTMGPKVLIIKKGEHGALLFAEDKVFFAPAVLVDDVIDPTGAGDSFAGGFMGYIAKAGNSSFNTLKRALIFGAIIASFTVEHFGTDGLLKITSKEVQDRLGIYTSMTDVAW